MNSTNIETESIQGQVNHEERAKDSFAVSITKDSDSISLSENQHSTDDQNSSRETQKGTESAYSKDESHNIIIEKELENEEGENAGLGDDQTKEIEKVEQLNDVSQSGDESQHQEGEDIQNNQPSEQPNIIVEQKPKTTEEMIKESREMDERVQQLLKQTQDSIQKTLDSTNKTLKSVAQTMQDINETNKKFDQFSEMYQNTMNQLGQKFAEAIKDSNLDNEDDFIPQITDISELSQILRYKREVAFVLGKGVLNGEKPNDLQQKYFYEEKSEEYWKMYGIIKERQLMSGYSEGDNNIVDIVNFLQTASTNTTLITTSIEDGLRGALFQHLSKENQNESDTKKQIGCPTFDEDMQNKGNMQGNEEEKEEEMILDQKQNQMVTYESIVKVYYEDEEEKSSGGKQMERQDKEGDQFDFDLFSGKYNYFQIHGNINFIRCSNNDCENKSKPEFFQSYGPVFQKPICSICKSPMRPHYKFTDDGNNENTYNIDWLKARINELDCLVLVGLDKEEKEEPLYTELIQKCIEYGILIFEVSMEPYLEIGYIRQLIGYPQELLMLLKAQLLYG